MADKINISSSVSAVEDEKTKKAKEEAENIRRKKQEADKKARDAEKERLEKEKEQEAALTEVQNEPQLDQALLLETGVSLAKDVLKSRKQKGFFRGLLTGFIAGALAAFLLMTFLKPPVPEPAAVQPAPAVTFTIDDFSQAVLEKASQHQELIVMEQPLSISTTISKAGLGNLAIFSKTKNVTFYGTGVYTVDLSHIDSDHMTLNEDEKTLYLKIPHASLQYINPDLQRAEFEDTQSGMLAFGELKLTAEEQNLLERSVEDSMRERLIQDDIMKNADEFAILKSWEIFQPLITAVSPEYRLEVLFED